MIIYGTRGITSSHSTGTFDCPRCGPQRVYTWQKVKTWFTLYFIPVFPVYTAGEYIECANCSGTYGKEVLSYDPVASQNKIQDDIRRILVLTALSEGTFDDMRIDSLQAAFAELTNVHIDEQELRNDYRQAQDANAQLTPFVHAVAADFSDQGKEHILSAAFATLSDRSGREQIRDQVLMELGLALGMQQANVGQLLQRMSQVL